MHPVDYNLLSLLKAGETLRLVLARPSGERHFSVYLEADPVKGRAGAELKRRISIFLRAIRAAQGAGYSLRPGGEDRKASRGVWMRISPRTRTLRTMKDGRLGFAQEGASSPGSRGKVIRVPAIGAVAPPDLVAYITEFIDVDDAVDEIRLSFTREELDDRWERVISSSLGLSIPELAAVIERDHAATAIQRFLALWLVRKSGWRVDLQAHAPSRRNLPQAALELLGREIFDAECVVAGADDSSADTADLDLSARYPEGWRFPRLLPPPDLKEQLNLLPVHNIRLPRLPASGFPVGEAEGEAVRLPTVCRNRHCYIIGATGSGKSTLLYRMIRHDIESGAPVVLLDPHGDLFSETLAIVPEARRRDLVVIDPGSTEKPIGLNILDVPRDELFGRRVDAVVGELIQFFMKTWRNTEAFGPMFEAYFRNAIMLMMYQDKTNHTLLDVERVLVTSELRAALCTTCTNESVVQFWDKLAKAASGEAAIANLAPYITSKVSPLVQQDYLRRVLGAPADELELDRRLDQRPVILVNLNKGLLSLRGSSLLGSLLVSRLFMAGLRRSRIGRGERAPVNIYIDEFQNFVSEDTADLFSEARKFGLRMHVANQNLGQLQSPHLASTVVESVLGNVGTMFIFRLGVPDAARLAQYAEPVGARQLQDLPNYHALARLGVDTGPIPPFIMKTLPADHPG